jgi:phage baseplate assembly protein W
MSNVRTFRDLDLNFTKHPVTKDVSMRIGDQAVIRSIRNLINLSFYEKPFHPEIGSSVRQMLFEPISPITTQNLKVAIEKVIANFEPRARVKNINVITEEDSNRVETTIEFFIDNNIEPTVITVFLERVR